MIRIVVNSRFNLETSQLLLAECHADLDAYYHCLISSTCIVLHALLCMMHFNPNKCIDNFRCHTFVSLTISSPISFFRFLRFPSFLDCFFLFHVLFPLFVRNGFSSNSLDWWPCCRWRWQIVLSIVLSLWVTAFLCITVHHQAAWPWAQQSMTWWYVSGRCCLKTTLRELLEHFKASFGPCINQW